MDKKMKVVIIESGRFARVDYIDGSLEGMQNVVKGLIEPIYAFDDNVAMVCNEEGKIQGLRLNRAIFYEGALIDIVAGTCFICGLGEDNFEGLNDELAEKYKEMFYEPQSFCFNGDDITVVNEMYEF